MSRTSPSTMPIALKIAEIMLPVYPDKAPAPYIHSGLPMCPPRP